MTMIDDVKAFHEAMGVPVLTKPEVPSADRAALRLGLIAEEFCELCEATGSRAESLVGGYDPELRGVALPDVADAIADLIYVLIGTAHEFGIPLEAVWNEVHAANMRKVDGPVRADGKKLKPPGWVGPDIQGVLKRAGWEP